MPRTGHPTEGGSELGKWQPGHDPWQGTQVTLLKNQCVLRDRFPGVVVFLVVCKMVVNAD